MSGWGWPQWTYAGLILVGLLWSAYDHGKPRTPQNFWATVVGAAITVWITASGGFWK